MVWRGRTALLGIPVLLLLAACGETPAPVPTDKTPAEACADLGDAVREFYDVASPGSTVTAVNVRELPDMNGFRIPQPNCTFEVRPDPQVIPGNVFTLENFYLDYDEELTEVIKQRLEKAGYKQKDPGFLNWSSKHFATVYTAAMLVYLEGDGHAYSEAADGLVLDLSVGQG